MRNGRSGRIIYFECMHTLENAHAMDRKTEDIIQIKSIIMLYFWIEETSFQTKDFHWRTFYRSPQRMVCLEIPSCCNSKQTMSWRPLQVYNILHNPSFYRIGVRLFTMEHWGCCFQLSQQLHYGVKVNLSVWILYNAKVTDYLRRIVYHIKLRWRFAGKILGSW